MKNLFKTKKFVVLFIIIFSLIILLFSCFRTIKSGEVGIRIFFGKVSEKTTNEGINFKVPLVEKIEKMNVRVQKIEVRTSSSSKDLQEVNMSLAVNYRIAGIVCWLSIW